jgi:hypothetical protein
MHWAEYHGGGSVCWRSFSSHWELEEERGADYLTADRKQSRALNMMGPGPDIVPKDTPPVTCFLQPGLTSCSLIVSQILFKSESINELNRSLGQSPHDLIVSGNTLTDPPGGMLY